MKSGWLCCFLAVALVFCMGGCATKTAPTFQASYYPDCYDPIDKLCKDQSNQQEAKSAVLGGVIGAVGGAIVGGLSTGKIEGALVGAGVGAAAGALTGFFAGRLNKIQEQDKRLAEYQNVLGESSRGWDIERASVERAYKCYGEQIKVLKKAIKSKTMDRNEFRARMNEIREGINNINTYWAGAQTRMDETLADGDKWLQQEDAAAAQAKNQKLVASQISRQKKNTQHLRENTYTANKKVNKVKDDVSVAYDELQKYMEVDKAYAGRQMLLAAL